MGEMARDYVDPEAQRGTTVDRCLLCLGETMQDERRCRGVHLCHAPCRCPPFIVRLLSTRERKRDRECRCAAGKEKWQEKKK